MKNNGISLCENDFLKKKNDAEWCCCVCDFFLVLMISEKTFLFCLSEGEIGRAYFCPSAHETPAFGKRGGAAGARDRSAEGMADFRREKNGEVARNVALRRKKGPPGKGAAKGDAAGEGTGREGTGMGRHGRGRLLRAAQRCARGNVGGAKAAAMWRLRQRDGNGVSSHGAATRRRGRSPLHEDEAGVFPSEVARKARFRAGKTKGGNGAQGTTWGSEGCGEAWEAASHARR